MFSFDATKLNLNIIFYPASLMFGIKFCVSEFNRMRESHIGESNSLLTRVTDVHPHVSDDTSILSKQKVCR